MNPARAFGLYPRKGTLAESGDADLTIVDLDREQRVTAGLLRSYSDYSLYENTVLRGWPTLTMVRGEIVMEEGAVTGTPGRAEYLHRAATPKNTH